MKQIINELQGVFEQLSADTAKQAVDCINHHNRIFVYAAGRSGLMLKAFAMRLAQMGRTVYVVGETVTPAFESSDLLILASASGTTASVCLYAGIAKDVGADLFIITATEDSALTAISPANIQLRTASKDTPEGSQQVMGSLFEQSLLLLGDWIISSFEYSGSAMRRRQSQFSGLHHPYVSQLHPFLPEGGHPLSGDPRCFHCRHTPGAGGCTE